MKQRIKIVFDNSQNAVPTEAVIEYEGDGTLESRIIEIEEALKNMDVNIISSIPLDVNVQDPTSPPIIVKFKKEISRTTSGVDTVLESNEITVVSNANFAVDRYVTIFDNILEKFYVGEVVNVVGNLITLDTPFEHVFPSGSTVIISNTHMNVDGSAVKQVFGVRSVGTVDVSFDITRILITGLTSSPGDYASFGNLAKLNFGIVLRRVNGINQTIFNAKSNGELANIMFDFEIFDAAKQGVDGFKGRLTFAGQSKLGVAVRLNPGDNLELVVQDNLSGLDNLELIAEGHLTVD